MNRCLAICQQAGFAEQHCTRAGTGQHGAVVVNLLQPLRFGIVEARNAFTGIDVEIRDADDIGLRAIRKIIVGPHPDAVCRAESLAVACDDVRTHALFARRSPRDE